MFTSCIMPVLEVQRSFRVFLKRTVVGGGTGLSIICMYHTWYVLASICLVTDVVRALMTPSDEDEERRWKWI